MRRLALLLLFSPCLANASVIDFDFETLPDSAGCAVAVSSYGGSHPSCDFDWIIDNNVAGIQAPIVDTEHGLTMEISSANNAIWFNGAYYCGNSPGCNAYVTNFSKGLDGISVDFQGVGTGDSEYFGDSFLYRISAWSGEFGTGDLLGTAEFLDIPLPPGGSGVYLFPLTLSLSGIGEFRSVSITALGRNFDDVLTNLGRVEAIHAVPEPGTLMLLGASLLAALWVRRSRSTVRADQF
jgi:hypothetical protein